MRVHVVNTGTELLLGEVINTHLAFIAQEILPLGLRVGEQRTVPDGGAIQDALRDLFGRTDIAFVTGGLGPTSDDLTLQLTAECLQLRLKESGDVREAIRNRLSARGVPMPDSIWRQALVPVGGEVLPNKNGTAPGIYLPVNVNPNVPSPHIFLLPGPPRELRPMFREFAMPVLHRVVSVARSNIAMARFRVARLGESLIEQAIASELNAISGVEVGYCARPAEVDVRIIGSPEAVGRASEIIRAKLGRAIFSSNEEQLAEVLVRRLRERGETLAVAESCTGGLLAHKITNVPGASEVLLGGFVTYSNAEKIRALGVSQDSLRECGAVSERVAIEMAQGARELTGATYAIATTGIAGPSGGTAEKPVGTVFVAIASPERKARCEKLFFPGERETFKELVAQHAFDLLREELR